MPLVIRQATPADADRVVQMAKDLCVFEQLPPSTFTKEEFLRRNFGSNPLVYTLVSDNNGFVCGYLMYYLGYTTDDGSVGVHLLDLYVDDAARGLGAGIALMRALAEECDRKHYHWMTWYIVPKNYKAAKFYELLGFSPSVRIPYYAGKEDLEQFTRKFSASARL